MWMRLDEENVNDTPTNETQVHDNEAVDHTQDNLKTDIDLEAGVEVSVAENNQELICEDDDADYDFVVVKQWNWRQCWHSRYSIVCLYIILALILVASLLALLIVVSMVTIPYHRASGFRRSLCEVISSHQHSAPSICSCGKGCDSHYPCLTVAVQYTDLKGSLQNASMYENEIILSKRCTFYPSCKAAHAENVRRVHDYRYKYGTPGQSYTCFYNPEKYTEVIRTHRFEVRHVIHGIVWSSVLILSSVIFLILAVWRKGCS